MRRLNDLIDDYTRLHEELVDHLKRGYLEKDLYGITSTSNTPPRDRVAITPLGRAVRVREAWAKEESEALIELVGRFPSRRAPFYSSKLRDYGINKSLKAVHIKLKNLDRFLRQKDCQIREESVNDENSEGYEGFVGDED
jgi:hypothetical protein